MVAVHLPAVSCAFFPGVVDLDDLSTELGDKSIAGRLGGDEFAFALQGGDQNAAQAIMTRLSQRLSTVTFKVDDRTMMPLTASIGLLWIDAPRPDLAFEDLLKQADQLMYQAKRAGKARCVIARVGSAKPQKPQ